MTFSLLGSDTQTGKRIEIPKSSRLQGLYIIGATGTGKTGLIENLIMQDIEQGLGVGLLDPHGDLTRAVLARLPQDREHDVILLDLTDYTFPFGLNLLSCVDSTNPLELQRTIDQVMHVFEKLFAVSRATPQLLEYLRNCTHTLIVNPGATLAEIPLLLQDELTRKVLLAHVTDSDVKLFWKRYEAKRTSDREEEASGVLRRVGEFLQVLSRPIIGQAISTIDMRSVLDERKILLVKLDPRLEMVTSLIGATMIALILNAAYSRADLDIKRRKQFHIYADEFQRFATEDFATLLTEARKFGIGTTIAHQMREQLDGQNKGATLNAANLVVFKISGKDAEELAGEFDSTPPPSGVIGQRPIYSPKRDVIDHLVKNGHKNSAVNAFATTYLVRLVDFLREKGGGGGTINLMDERGFFELSMVHADDVRRGVQDLNDTLYACMVDRDAFKPLSPYTLLAFAFYFRFAEAIGIGDWSYNDNWKQHFKPKELTLAFCQPDIFKQQATLQKQVLETALFGKKKKEAKFQAAMQFITSIREAMEVLAVDPILVDTGQHEPIFDKPRPYADVQNEIASTLTNLPRFTARVKIAEENITIEYTIQTLIPERGLGKLALQERIERIREQNRRDGYTRSRQEVEEEIGKRHETLRQVSQEQPGSISRRGAL